MALIIQDEQVFVFHENGFQRALYGLEINCNPGTNK